MAASRARTADARTADVRAAGAVVLRRRDDGRTAGTGGAGGTGGTGAGRREVALVYRDRYDDWTLPKGKLEPGETLPQAAVREVAEETGIEARLGVPLDQVRYRLANGAEKSVDYWVGEVATQRHRPPDDEIAAVVWVDVDAAVEQLSFERDRIVLAQAASMPDTVPLVIVRHAKAVSRSNWSGSEASRPLTPFGQRQARALNAQLAAYDVSDVVTSPWRRCRATVLPYVARRHLEATVAEPLTEESAAADPELADRWLRELVDRVAASGTPTVLCGHRPVLPQMLSAVGVHGDRKVRTAEFAVAHLDRADGSAVAVEWHRPGTP